MPSLHQRTQNVSSGDLDLFPWDSPALNYSWCPRIYGLSDNFFFPENKPLCPCSSHRGLWKKTDDLTLLHQIYLLSPKSLLLPFQVADSSQWVSLMGSGGGIGCSTYHPYPSPGTLVVTSFIFTSHLLLCSIPYPLSF